MDKLVTDTIEDLHSIVVHFPIALLVIFAALTVYARFRPNDGLLLTSWVLLVLGTLGAIAASITGLISLSRVSTLSDSVRLSVKGKCPLCRLPC